MQIDLRSDTVTMPTPGMLKAMMNARVGDDVFGEDPTVKALEEKLSLMFGMEGALFCPSGTMTNQIAIRTLTQPQDEVICDEKSHVYLYEGGGMASNSMVSVCLLKGDRGRINAEMVKKSINPDDIYRPVSRLVCIENTMNKGGGSCYDFAEIHQIHAVCKDKGLKLHLDGARLFNAIIAKNERPEAYGQYFDSISICLSKGLGAPVGSVLLGSGELIKKAMRVRKVFGGAMRQAGYLAAAGIYALDNHVERLAEDHQMAAIIAQALGGCAWVTDVMPTETNIVIFEVDQRLGKEAILHKLKEKEILAVPFGEEEIRMVTHLDFSESMLDRLLKVLRSI
ncbi:MAG: threonine aldolase [Cyclobacteriaceae bacterium]|nr:threonine aldolase [Cyclobacteriaceae bacterium]